MRGLAFEQQPLRAPRTSLYGAREEMRRIWPSHVCIEPTFMLYMSVLGNKPTFWVGGKVFGISATAPVTIAGQAVRCPRDPAATARAQSMLPRPARMRSTERGQLEGKGGGDAAGLVSAAAAPAASRLTMRQRQHIRHGGVAANLSCCLRSTSLPVW
eukprot:COSAG01_NODE_7710_length_3089_cov_6.196656_2_plen_157_part_00